MKAIIPVKANSTRVPNKNFREFYNNKSLTDLTIEKLLKVLSPCNIYVSCENQAAGCCVMDEYGINFIKRPISLTRNDAPMIEVVQGIAEQISGDDDIAWCQVIDPLFDEYKECFQTWMKIGYDNEFGNDSLIIAYEMRDYILNANFDPQGFGFGPWHLPSQQLPLHYRMTFVLHIMTRDCVRKYGYTGVNPYFFTPKNQSLDIDTEEDFEAAQQVYAARQLRSFQRKAAEV